MDAQTRLSEDVGLLNGLASVQFAFGQYATALSFLELANWLWPDNDRTLNLMAKVYFRMRKSDNVISVLDRLETVTDTPLSEEQRLLKGRSYALLGRIDEARDVLLLH